MFNSLTMFFYRRIVISKMRKLKKKSTHWNGDLMYNNAIDDCVAIIIDTGGQP